MRLYDDYIVRLIDLPYGIGGVVSEDSDGFYSIYLNARHTREKNKESLKHELRHIKHNDFHNKRSIREIES